MKETFDKIYPDLKVSEGVTFVDDPHDPGGATYVGITLKNYRLQVDPKATVDTLKALTDDQIKAYYKQWYWDKVSGDLLPAGIDYSVFDFGVNSGPATAVMKLQKIVGTTSDGIVGNQTLAAVANKSQPDLIKAYSADRLSYLKKTSGWSIYGTGWTNRINRVMNKSLELDNSATAPAVQTVSNTEVKEQKSNVALKIVGSALLFLLKRLIH